MMKKILLEDALILNAIRAGRFFIRFLPFGVCLFFARSFALCIFSASKRRHVAYKNLRAAFAREKTRPEMKRIARRSVQNLAVAVAELLRVPYQQDAYLRGHLRLEGMEKAEALLKEGKGVLFLTAHFGSWELLGIAAGLHGYPMLALVRSQKHPRSDAFLNSLRSSKGSQVVTTGMPMRQAFRALKAGKIVGILSDQDGGPDGRFVRFFGRLSSMQAGAAAFALRTNAAIFPVFLLRETSGHLARVEEALKVPADLGVEEAETTILQQFAQTLESKIRQSPDQWLWGHGRWKSTPDRSIVVLSDGKAGHLNQSLALADAIKKDGAERRPRGRTEVTVIDVRFKSKSGKNFLKTLAWLTRGRLPFKPALMKALLKKECYERLMRTFADVVISCGSSITGVHLLAVAENRAKSAIVMKTHLPPRRFDAVIVPRHDKLKTAPNVFVVDGALSSLTRERLESEAGEWARTLALGPGKRVGFLVGGDAGKMKFTRDKFESIVAAVRRVSAESGAVVLATTSRRTPPWADEMLKEAFQKNKNCGLLVIANESNREGVVPGILGLSDVLLVSGESVSMISEALSTGKPVIVFIPAQEAALKAKHLDFLRRMAEEKRITLAPPSVVGEVLAQSLTAAESLAPGPVFGNEEIMKAAARRLN